MRFRVFAVAVVVVVGVLMSGVSASGASCMDGLGRGPGAVVTDPDTRLPVIAVHGWRSSASVWDMMGAQLSTLGENPPALSRFDYSHVNDQWVTHPDIGPRLAEWIDCLAEVSRVSGGSGRVALVGHSMGGLAIRAALDGDGARAAKVAFIATLGTPHQGSVFGGDWSLNDDLRSIGGALGDMFLEWVTMHGPAKTALGTGSRELASLPAIPSGPPVLAAAGNLILESRVLFWTSSQPVGDGIVGQASATAQSAKVGNLGGTDTMECRIATTLTGVAPTDLFSAPPLVLHQIEKYGWNCIHTKLPQSAHLINALAAQLTAATRTPSVAQDIEVAGVVDEAYVGAQVGCADDCTVTGLVSFDHPTWGASTLATFLTLATFCEDGPNGVAVFDQSGSQVWDWSPPEWMGCLRGLVPLGSNKFDTYVPPRLAGTQTSEPIDALGHIFIVWEPGRYNGLIVLRPLHDGMEVVTTPYLATTGDVDGDGKYEILDVDDCEVPCGGARYGSFAVEALHWNGSTYVARWDDPYAFPLTPEKYEALFGSGADNAPSWSGCSPGTATSLPDGIWFGWVVGWSRDRVEFDLGCFYPPRPGDDYSRITNDTDLTRLLGWSPNAQAYAWSANNPYGNLDGPFSVEDLLTGNAKLLYPVGTAESWAPPPVLLYVNDGLVTEVEALFES